LLDINMGFSSKEPRDYFKRVRKAITEGIRLGLDLSMESINNLVREQYLGSKRHPDHIGPRSGRRQFDKDAPRPGGKQSLYIRSGILRKSLKFGTLSKYGRSGDMHSKAKLGKNLAIGFSWTPKDYGKFHEFGKYEFIQPAVKEYLKTNKFDRNLTAGIEIMKRRLRLT